MDMPMATTTTSSMTMSSTSSSDSMSMAFNTNNLDTMLFSKLWMPTTTGAYVGTWFFLFFLAVIWRGIVASLSKLDAFWAAKNAQYPILIKGGEDKPSQKDIVKAWRISVNLPRAVLRMISQGIAWLLMISVMSMNVGYFFAALIGYFIGELIFGRVTRGHIS